MVPGGIAAQFRGTLGQFSLDVAFAAPGRGITALFGRSGSGKTTVLRCVAGLARLPGRLAVDGEVWQDERTFLPTHRRAIGYVFQEASLLAHLSVRDNLLYGHRRALRAGVPESIRFDDAVALLGLALLLDRAPARLSGGERQRVAIGRALLSQPRLLLLDEPLSGLDRAAKAEILPYLEALHATLAIPALYVSHDIAEVERLADHVVLLDAGRVSAAGPLADILADTSLSLAGAVEAASVIAVTVRSYDAADRLLVCDLAGETLLVSGAAHPAGTAMRVRIAAGDISLATEMPSRTTILNVLPAAVVEVAFSGEGHVTVVLAVGAGARDRRARLLARITRRSAAAFGFAPGQHVFAQIKAASLVAARQRNEEVGQEIRP